MYWIHEAIGRRDYANEHQSQRSEDLIRTAFGYIIKRKKEERYLSVNSPAPKLLLLTLTLALALTSTVAVNSGAGELTGKYQEN